MGLGTQEIVLILLVLLLLFGAKKLPELARGGGRALRIFKAETKGLMDDDDTDAKPAVEQQGSADPAKPVGETDPRVEPVVEKRAEDR